MQSRFELASLRPRLRASSRIGDSEQDLLTMRHRLAIAGGEPVETESRHDGIEPGGKARVSTKFRQAPVRAEKGFLGDLLALGGIAEHAQGHAEDPVLMRGDQLLEGP